MMVVQNEEIGPSWLGGTGTGKANHFWGWVGFLMESSFENGVVRCLKNKILENVSVDVSFLESSVWL